MARHRSYGYFTFSQKHAACSYAFPGIPHSTTQDDWYGDYFIPKGSLVMSNLWRVPLPHIVHFAPTDSHQGRSRMTRRYTRTQVRSAPSASWAIKKPWTRTRSSSASGDAGVPVWPSQMPRCMPSCRQLSRRSNSSRARTGHQVQTSSRVLSGEPP